MTLYLTPTFINDIRSSHTTKFVRSILSHAIAPDGTFPQGTNDHRYNGIQDAWIRYASGGDRIIYVRRGEHLYLYRAGPHSIEERLQPPSLEGAIPVNTDLSSANSLTVRDCLLKTTEVTFLSRFIESMYHAQHKTIMLVSPTVELQLLSSRASFGHFLDRAIEEHTAVSLVTQPPLNTELPDHKRLEERDIDVYFHPHLRCNVYFFDIDLYANNPQEHRNAEAIIGSSCLSAAALGLGGATSEEHLCCRVPNDNLEAVREYLEKLIIQGVSHSKYALQMKRTPRK